MDQNNNENKNESVHEYDGIKENNYPMPGWWVWTFIFTIVFAALYYLHYEISGSGLTLQQELEISMKELSAIQKTAAQNAPVATDDDIQKMLNDPQILSSASEVYKNRCAMCHGDNLEGKIGPNLTDSTWIHGNATADIGKVIKEGVSSKGMPAWTGLLTPEEINHLIAFIKSKGK